MEQSEMIIVVCCGLAAVIGLVFVVLQKKGKMRPAATFSVQGLNVTSGGTIVLLGAILGAVMLYKYSILWMIIYLAVIVGIYILIQVIYRGRK